jgi:hypothetical protein
VNPRSVRIGVVLGVAIAIGAAFLIRHGRRSPAVRESDATEVAPAPSPTPPAPPPTEATRITRAPAPAAPPALPEPRPAADDEAAATARARDVVRSNPERALALLDAADQAHPNGGLAEERAAMRVDALVFAQRIGEARDAAEVYLARYPHGPQAQRIEMLTGVHPHPTEPSD